MLAANAVESRSFSNRQVFGNGRIAQLVEQLTLNQRVLGSSPSASTKTLFESQQQICAIGADGG